jgi:Tol biopolymer transport system component
MKVSVGGGPAVLLSDKLADIAVGGSWGSQGVILVGSISGPLRQLSEAGGETKPVLPLDASRQETGQDWPQFLPDGKHYLYFSLSPKAAGVYVASLGSSEKKNIMLTDSQAWFVPPGYLLSLRKTTLMAQSFDPSKALPTGGAFPVAEGVGRTNQFGGVTFSASANGTLVYRAGSSPDSTITVFDRSGRRLRTVGPPGQYEQISLSPDGKRLAIDRKDPVTSSYDLWILDLSTGIMSRLTFDPANDRDATWSPDSRQIAFSSDRTGQILLYRKTIGSANEELLYQSDDREIPEAWLKDGSILFGNLRGKKYHLLRPGDPGQPRMVFQSEYTMDEPSVSPDQKWVAYGSMESGRFEVYTARFPDFTERRQVSSNSGAQPHWRQDGKQIVYLTMDGKLMAVDVKQGPTLETGTPYLLFETRLRASATVEQFSMSQDGTMFYLPDPAQEAEKPMTVVLNWPAQSRR